MHQPSHSKGNGFIRIVSLETVITVESLLGIGRRLVLVTGHEVKALHESEGKRVLEGQRLFYSAKVVLKQRVRYCGRV